MATTYKWCYYQEKWCDMPDATAKQLETAHNKGQKQVQIKSGNWAYDFDLINLIQVNAQTGTRSEIDRIEVERDGRVKNSLLAQRLVGITSLHRFSKSDGSGADADFVDDDQLQLQTHVPQQQQQQQQQPMWQFFDVTFKDCSNHQQIESYYQQNNKQGTVQLKALGHTYTIDFTNMQQTNNGTGVVRQLQRILR